MFWIAQSTPRTSLSIPPPVQMSLCSVCPCGICHPPSCHSVAVSVMTVGALPCLYSGLTDPCGTGYLSEVLGFAFCGQGRANAFLCEGKGKRKGQEKANYGSWCHPRVLLQQLYTWVLRETQVTWRFPGISPTYLSSSSFVWCILIGMLCELSHGVVSVCCADPWPKILRLVTLLGLWVWCLLLFSRYTIVHFETAGLRTSLVTLTHGTAVWQGAAVHLSCSTDTFYFQLSREPSNPGLDFMLTYQLGNTEETQIPNWYKDQDRSESWVAPFQFPVWWGVRSLGFSCFGYTSIV